MHDDIAQVQQHPLIALAAFDADRRVTRLFRRFHDAIDQRFDVPVGRAAGENHVVGD